MKAAVLAIGDELLIGQVVNTNAAVIAQLLGEAGIGVARVVTVGDDRAAIIRAVGEEFARHDLLLVTGGLGPTHDDITRDALAEFFGVKLVSDPEVRRRVAELLASRDAPWTEAAENQTLIAEGATAIPNSVGTAPGELFERDGKFLVVMPGVPQEMEAMMRDFIVPRFRDRGGAIIHTTLNTTGITESSLAALLGDPAGFLTGGATLAFLPSLRGVRLRISVGGADAAAASRAAGAVERHIREKAAPYIFGTGDELLEEVVGRMLVERGMTLAVAESCTGGLIADRITDIPGSSTWFERGVVAYSNAAKIGILGVPPEIIAAHVAVSNETACAMAEGIRRIAHADVGLAVTGIAGPSGGSAEKPVGLVWIAVARSSDVAARAYRFGTGRRRVKERAAQS